MKATGQKKSAPGIVSRLPQPTTNRYWNPGADPPRLTAAEATASTASIQTGHRTTLPLHHHRTHHHRTGAVGKTGLHIPVTLRKHRVGAGLTLPGTSSVWASILHCYAHAEPQVRTTFRRFRTPGQHPSEALPAAVATICAASRQASNAHAVGPSPNDCRNCGNPARKSRLHIPVTLPKRILDAGLPVLMAFMVWTVILQTGAQAGPETRITSLPPTTPATLPTAAYEPPARGAAEPADGAEGAKTTTDLLTFIRALEAPRGYDDYERRIPTAPPKPLTAMTVGEVLDWQVRLRRAGAVSTAAGGYQIIYPTLKRLVAKYGLSRSLRFNATTQDHLARLLIGECGAKGPITRHPRYGNCLAGIWAALPLTHGTRKGRSAHHGVAGNRARTRPETVLALLAGQPVAIPVQGPRQSLDPTAALARIGRSLRSDPLAFEAARIPVETRQSTQQSDVPARIPGLAGINAALRKARRDGTLTPALGPAIKTWKQDPYAQE